MKYLIYLSTMLILSGCDVQSGQQDDHIDSIQLECIDGREYVIFVNYYLSAFDVEPTGNPCKSNY